ncbi:hypothetical protein MTX78_22570 [Hymenobacter tibetensis]|uniref:STAS/SEC14 domain-containing protein n=1 Tax=Hymenobacter tibetensis TaxID=497967 RepID=A0ABY4CX80_9BACT|nr:hypothetical protein [Hymenobacter tibetensis]UOG74886.1 hypothetical protein MTX78_22570 [Hymenobacter tibetensis]
MAATALPEVLLPTAHRADLDILVGRWSCQPEPDQLPGAYAHLTREAVASGCRFWLQDIRSRTLNDPHTTQWLLTQYFPQMASQLGGRLSVAYLTSPTLMELLVNAPGFRTPDAYATEPFVIAFFGTEGEALTWLEQQRSH